MIPSAIALAGLAATPGISSPSESEPRVAFQVVRRAPVRDGRSHHRSHHDARADRTNPVRLLLLPIHARTLYVAQAGGALSDPWIILMLPPVLALPVGLLIGGAGVAVADRARWRARGVR